MNTINSRMTSVTTAFMVLFIFTSLLTWGQDNKKLKVYDSPEQMVADAKESISEIPVKEFRNIYNHDDIYVVDVRTAEEYNEAAIPGAVNIPRGVLEFRIGEEKTWEASGKDVPGKNDTIMVYCRTGGRGALAAKALKQLGYINVRSVKGGMVAWEEAYPELTSQKKK